MLFGHTVKLILMKFLDFQWKASISEVQGRESGDLGSVLGSAADSLCDFNQVT